MTTATNRKLAAQGIRAVLKRGTLSDEERRLLQENSNDTEVIERVLESYEKRQVWQAGHGDIPLGLRRVLRLLK